MSEVLEKIKDMKNWSKYNPGIFQYNGKYINNWFSNMKESPIENGNLIYPTVEHFYQAMKEENPIMHVLIAKAESPYKAKQLGKAVNNPFTYLLNNENMVSIFTSKLLQLEDILKTSNIEKVKLTIMYIGLFLKFEIPEWKEKLLATNDEIIVEWNNWGDRFWGVDIKDNKGYNWLGKLLMKIREDLRVNAYSNNN